MSGDGDMNDDGGGEEQLAPEPGLTPTNDTPESGDQDNTTDHEAGEQRLALETASAGDDAALGGANQDMSAQEAPDGEDESVAQGDPQGNVQGPSQEMDHEGTQEMDHEGTQEETAHLEVQNGDEARGGGMDGDDFDESDGGEDGLEDKNDLDDNDLDDNGLDDNNLDDNNLDDNGEEAEQATLDTIEILGARTESLQQNEAGTDMADQHDDPNTHNDVDMDESTQADDTQLEPEGLPQGRAHDDSKQEDDAEAMHDVQVDTGEPVQGGSNFQSAQVGEEQLDNDSSSLFVPEVAFPRTSPQAPPRPGPSVRMLPPPRPSGSSTSGTRSIFSKIRSMQKANTDKRNAIKKREEAARHREMPDSETYLDAVMASVMPSASMSRPEVPKYEAENRQALAEFQRQQKHYAELKHNNGGALTFRQDIMWMKIKGAETTRRKKYARDLAMARDGAEEEPGLFPDSHPVGEDDEGDEWDDSFDLDAPGPSRKRRGREMPRKEPKQMSMQEAELQSMRVALEAGEDMPKKKRKSQPEEGGAQDTRSSNKGKRPKTMPKTTRAKAAPKTTKKGPRKSAKIQREADNAIKQATSLFTSNVFEQQAGEDDEEQPTFRARNKQDALKELIASVPIGEQKNARDDMNTIIAAGRDFDGHGSVRAAGGNWMVKGMTTSLKSYQVLGSGFMRRRENSDQEPRGGLMADQMGLGKTLMMLANIINGLPKKGVQPRTTLLIASPSLLAQWAQEIEQHTDARLGLKVLRYGAGTRIDSNAAFEILGGHDVILTSYNEVMRSYPKNEPPIECQTVAQKMEWWKTQYETQRGVLHRMMFLRVVLDEAQAIKNHQSRTSIACRALIARHKWALSGTPILNNLSELYPYFKFLGVPHTGSFKIFKHNYCDSRDVENTERLLVRLAQFMIRRTHADKLFSRPILKLPRADQATFWCEFNPVERCIYDIVRQRFAKRINMWQMNGELEKSYSNALVMLLRLRQLTAHVLMLQLVMKDLLEVEDIERIKTVVQETADINTPRGRTIIAIRKQLESHAIREKKLAAMKADKRPTGEAGDGLSGVEDREENEREEESDEESGLPTGQVGAGAGGSGKAFGKDYNFKPFLASLKTGESWEKAKKKATCSYCDQTPKTPWISSCQHFICGETCLEAMYLAAAELQQDYVACKTCGVIPISYEQVEDDEADALDGVAQGTRSKAGKKAARQRARRDNDDISEDWLSLAGAEVLPSAKTLAIKAQILNWWKEDPNVKIIIYTQFLAM
jgi:hypothetical protein